MAATKKAEKRTVVQVTDSEARKEAIASTLRIIEKDFGKGAVMKLGDNTTDSIPVIPTGVLSLDVALGVGGLPRGRIIEIYGPESSGKTTLSLLAIAQAQKEGGTAAFIDAEHALDPVYCKKLGVDIDELFVSQPDTGEQALDICETLVRSGAVDVIVIDSVAALVPKAEIEGDMGDSHVGLQARLMSQALRKLAGVVSKTNAVVIFLNQLREKVTSFGNPETTAGGNALKFYATIRIDMRPKDKLKAGKEISGNRVLIKVVKNKVAPPFRTCMVEMLYGEGISIDGDLLDLAVSFEVIRKNAAFFYYQGLDDAREECIGQGRDAARVYLRDHAYVALEVRDRILAELKETSDLPDIEPVDSIFTGADEIDLDDGEFELD